MALKPNITEEAGPDEAHFALLVDEAGMRLAITPGASLWLVENKNHQDKIFPLVLKKVSVKKIVFEMRQPDGNVTEYTYQLTTAKPTSRGAYQKLLANRGGKPVVTQK